MKLARRVVVGLLLFIVLAAAPAQAQTAAAADYINPAGIDGTVLICLPGSDEAQAKFTELAAMEKARLVVLDGSGVEQRDGDNGGGENNLLPGAVFGPADRDPPPGCFRLTFAPGAALLARGRQLRSVGESEVRFALAASKDRPAREETLKPGAVEDLTLWRRAARARTQPAYPPAKLDPPVVASGSLVIVGGGGMPEDVGKKFVELAGGPEALIVVLPTSMPDPLPQDGGSAFLQRLGAKNVRVLGGRQKNEVESADALEALDKAGGVWFGGGRQWRFVDAYEGTAAYERLQGVLRRGGVIGGSSAGATIQGDYLVRGSPHGPQFMMCEGYERGFAFLPGVAIDQHFAQRKRFADMTALMKAYPQYLGLGLDEATALVVQGQVATVLGRGQAHVYDRRLPVAAEGPDYQSLKAGTRFDLVARKVVEE